MTAPAYNIYLFKFELSIDWYYSLRFRLKDSARLAPSLLELVILIRYIIFNSPYVLSAFDGEGKTTTVTLHIILLNSNFNK